MSASEGAAVMAIRCRLPHALNVAPAYRGVHGEDYFQLLGSGRCSRISYRRRWPRADSAVLSL